MAASPNDDTTPGKTMTLHRPFPPAAVGALLAALALAGCGTAQRAPLDAAASQSACTAMAANAGLPATTLTATYLPAGTARAPGATAGPFLPGHCLVRGSIGARTGIDGKPYATGFELSLPDAWNGRFVYMGGGGNDGTLRSTYGVPASVSSGTPPPLAQGYAVVSTDAGHSGTSAAFGLDPQARIDHAYAAHDKTATAAKELIRQRFGRAPDRSYFVGCSGGGRQGMMFSQRFPSYFDGIVAGAPAMKVSSGASVAAMWDTIRFDAIAPVDASGSRILSRAFSDADLALVAQGVNAACDAADGAADGMVANVRACRFDPAALQCAGAKTASCLSGPQVGALKAAYAGPTDSAGRPLYATQMWDPGIAGPDWRNWKLGTSTTAQPNSRHVFLMRDAIVNEFFTPPDPGYDVLKFDFDRDPARMAWFSAVYDTYFDATLAAYRQRGGKLLFVHGQSDPIFSVDDTLDYVGRLTAANGGRAATEAFARTFLVPGMTHCTGGPATDTFDALQAVVDWVEKGVALERIDARATAANAWFPNRTRPLCPYPKFARYNGSGSIEDGANFSCAEN